MSKCTKIVFAGLIMLTNLVGIVAVASLPASAVCSNQTDHAIDFYTTSKNECVPLNLAVDTISIDPQSINYDGNSHQVTVTANLSMLNLQIANINGNFYLRDALDSTYSIDNVSDCVSDVNNPAMHSSSKSVVGNKLQVQVQQVFVILPTCKIGKYHFAVGAEYDTPNNLTIDGWFPAIQLSANSFHIVQSASSGASTKTQNSMNAKAGGKCQTKGEKAVIGSKSYICGISGKKLIWLNSSNRNTKSKVAQEDTNSKVVAAKKIANGCSLLPKAFATGGVTLGQAAAYFNEAKIADANWTMLSNALNAIIQNNQEVQRSDANQSLVGPGNPNPSFSYYDLQQAVALLNLKCKLNLPFSIVRLP